MLALRFAVFAVLATLIYGKGVILILGGNAGKQMGAYQATDIQTPNLDNLAKEGVLFNNAFTANVAAGDVSRASILSGLPSHQAGQFGTSGQPSMFQTHAEVKGLPKILFDSNFVTGIIGNTGLGQFNTNVYPFVYRQTEINNDPIGIGRNITLIKYYVEQFFNTYKSRDFFLVLSLGDAERCPDMTYGQFCEKFGDGSPGMGSIPDWTPVSYNESNLKAPYFVSQYKPPMQDLVALYRSANRLDQGVGLYMSALASAGLTADTMVIYSSTGGLAFPGAQYNAYEGGVAVPLIISCPAYSKGQSSEALVSTLDLTPTILQYLGVTFPPYFIFGQAVSLTGQSLIPVLADTSKAAHSFVFATQDLIEIQDNFPIRSIRNASYKLIRNSVPNYPITRDVFNTPTFQFYLEEIRKFAGHTGFWRPMEDYLKRPEFELYDYSYDPYEVDNVADEPKYAVIASELKATLASWQTVTQDPWICNRGQTLVGKECQSYF